MQIPTHTPMSASAVSRGAASPITPPAASMTAAASCGGAMERVTTWAVSAATDRDSDHNPRAAMTTAAHTHWGTPAKRGDTPAMSMGPQYEAARRAAAPGY